jgi:N-acetylmuramoyl-L-alanine amidase
MQLPVIVLDPGHGGEDPGAISKSGRFERDAALEMALTAKFLLAMNGWDVRLTRDGSEKVKPDLHRRVWLAEQVKAKALVSIHYNSHLPVRLLRAGVGFVEARAHACGAQSHTG